MKRFLLVFGFLLISGMLSGHANATTIDFSGLGKGTISVNGSDIVGSGVPIQLLTVNGTPTADGQYAVSSGVLNFSYGPDETNSISVNGAVGGLGIPDIELLHGTFTQFTDGVGNFLTATLASGTDTKSPYLLAALGLPLNTQFTFFDFTISTNTGGLVLSDIVNTSVSRTSVPEPSSLILLGSGLVGLGLWGRKRLQQ